MLNNPRRVRTRALCLAAAVAGGWSLAAAPAAHAQALDQVPADALVVLKANHLGDTNAKVIDLLQKLGVTDLVPQASDPLKALEDALGVPATSVDPKRDAAIYMANAPMGNPPAGGDADDAQPPLVLLLPVTDYKAFIGGLTDAKTDGEVTTGHFKNDNGTPNYIVHWGDYAALAPRKELLSGKHDGLKPTGSAARELEQKDVCVYVNFPALKPVLLPELAKARAKAQDQAEQKMADADPAKKQLAHAAADQAFNVAERFLNDAQPTTAGLAIDKAGIAGNLVVAFAEGSYLGKMFGHLKTTDGPLLGGLPDEKYLFFGGSIQDPKMATQLFDDLSGPLLPKLAALGDAGKQATQLVDLFKQAMADSDGGAAGLVVPTAAIQQGSLVRYIAVLHADAAKLMAAQEQAATLSNQLMASLGLPGADLTKTTITKASKTVDGVPFDLVETKVDPAANNPQAAQAQQAMSFIYGPDGQANLIGAVNAHTLVTTMGVDDQLLGSTIEAAKSNKDVLTAQVKVVDAALPKTRSAVAYFDVAQLVTTGLSYAHAMGMNLPVQLPANLPPIGVSLGSDPDASALRMDGYVPTTLLQSMVQAGFQIYLNTPHGGGGGM